MKITVEYTSAKMREVGIIEAFIKALTGSNQIRTLISLKHEPN